MTTFTDILQKFYLESPNRACIYLQRSGQDDLSISYSQLIEGANAYAQIYAKKGIKSGEVVVLILQHSPDLLYAFWGAVLHGAIPSIMPFLTEKLSPERYREDLSALISVTKPVSIITYPEFEGNIKDAFDEGDSVREVILSDEIPSASRVDFCLLSGLQHSPDDIVLLQHSSGTTGLQKGVALSHRAVLKQLNAYSESISLDREKDVIISWLPLYHDMGLIASFLLPILKGIPLVLISPFDWVRAPYKLMHSVSQYKGTLTWMPNFAYIFCARKIRERHLEDVDLSSWRAIINCSEPVRWESHQDFFEKFKEYGLKLESLQTSYAMAENTFAVTQSNLLHPPAIDNVDAESLSTGGITRPASAESLSVKMMSSGRAIPNTRIRILNLDGEEVQEREVGEIALKSDCMLTEYYNRPQTTEKAFEGEWYLTGDFGYLVGEELFVSGRKKEMIIVGGKNIYPQDLERLVYEVDGIHAGRAVAFGLYDERTGTEEVIIVAEANVDTEEARYKLADEVRKHVTINSAVALRQVKIVPEKWILKTSSGKAARGANKEKYLREA
ncbi:MAG: AMP-binding protein [Anaerolineae bacterium]|jgi:fatty-acyl-CoA synthase|nr:AMP-binding protein [Anaerolineae bacterium]MBT7781477.1 AMP-binding protein [Anaerolineae bacterium]